MAETLLAILLVTTSANESNLVFRWPEFPSASPRLSRAPPDPTLSLSHLDNTWRASHSDLDEGPHVTNHDYGRDSEYCWPRPNVFRDGFPDHTLSGRSSPTRGGYSYDEKRNAVADEYDQVLGYSAEFLAQHLCPQRSMCHQKFELIVDDLAFIGHPVCADSHGSWNFQPEKVRPSSRGRETTDVELSVSPRNEHPSLSPEVPPSETPISSAAKSTWLKTFHLVLVLDLPDPSSSASGNLSKYFNVLYEQIAFVLTAVLYQQQVLYNFVENECDTLTKLKDNYISKGEPFSKYALQAFEVSSIAPAMKTLYEAIKSSSVAYLNINFLPLELQLPPYLDTLLHNEEDNEEDFYDSSDDEVTVSWGQNMNLGWKLPAMKPWKTLLLLDIDNDMDPHQILKGSYENPEDKTLLEGLIRFLETASVTMSLFEMATLLEWDLESQVYPIVKWLFLHRRAKVVDVVHTSLKTVFALPPKFGAPLSRLTKEFSEAFSHPSIPPLPRILYMISSSMSKQTDNHFFASVVKSKELIAMYHDVVLWMLKRDMLIALHLRIRIVATRDLKARVKVEKEVKDGRKARHRTSELQFDEELAATSHDSPLFPLSKNKFFPSKSKSSKRMSSNESGRSEISELDFDLDEKLDLKPGRDGGDSEDEADSGWDTTEDHILPSIITDPGKATPMQRRWLAAMSVGKDPQVARRFELINQYFDGKRSDDEILYRAEITRKQLREVLHHYEEYLQTFLHPS